MTMIYEPPLRDMRFVLHELLNVQDRADIAGYPDQLTPDDVGAILEEAGKLARDVILPTNQPSDQHGCVLENGVVRTPPGYADAWAALTEGGWTAIDVEEQYGGMGLPCIMNAAVGEMHSACGMAFTMYQGLSHGAASAIHSHGTQAQKDLYLPNLASGKWTGTMNLTEPHCGTDLGLLRSKAEPDPDEGGAFRITGTKIFISAGEHDLSENIVHLVLARLPDAPEGVKGISMFAVPKFLPNADGAPGERNSLACARLEHKMGINGNATCEMKYDGAKGWLVGDPHKGLRAMFTMMNEARLMVGMQGLSQMGIAYQNALAYAKDRLQGRALDEAKNPDGAADPLIVHPDVRRMLMEAKSLTEGGRAFYYWAATLIDSEKRATDETQRKTDGDLIALLTPVVKGFLTDKGYDVCTKMQQVYGGHGYIEEWGASQFVRDSRIAMIYEGANGVQALDLIGRKLPQSGGAAMRAFFAEVVGFCKQHGDDEFGAAYIDPLKAASKDLQAAVMWMMQNGMKDPNEAAAGSMDFLHMFGHVCLGYMWARTAVTAQAALDAGTDDAAFYGAKLKTARFYMARMLPETGVRLARITSGAAPVMDMDVDQF